MLFFEIWKTHGPVLPVKSWLCNLFVTFSGLSQKVAKFFKKFSCNTVVNKWRNFFPVNCGVYRMSSGSKKMQLYGPNKENSGTHFRFFRLLKLLQYDPATHLSKTNRGGLTFKEKAVIALLSCHKMVRNIF